MLLTHTNEGSKNTTMGTITTKMKKETLRQLRMIHAITDETMQAIMARLVSKEFTKLHRGFMSDANAMDKSMESNHQGQDTQR